MNPSKRGYTVTSRDKYFIALQKEQRELQDIQYRAPLIKLENPYQQGWVRYFRLREDATRHKDAIIFKEILEKINSYQYCRTGTFMHRYYNTKKLVPIEHSPKYFSRHAFDKIPWDCNYKKHFTYRLVTEQNWKNEFVQNYYYVFRYTHYLVSTIDKNIITHQKANMPEIESRLIEIQNYFERHQVWKRLGNLFGNGYRWNRKKPEINEYQEISLGLTDTDYE